LKTKSWGNVNMGLGKIPEKLKNSIQAKDFNCRSIRPFKEKKKN